MIIGPWLNLTEIHKDNIGIDEQGIWYGEGVHFKKITEVPLKGTIQIDYNKNLAYNLTKEEVVSLERGSSFPERLREDITIRYEKWNVILEDIPEGIDHNHVQLIIISS